MIWVANPESDGLERATLSGQPSDDEGELPEDELDAEHVGGLS